MSDYESLESIQAVVDKEHIVDIVVDIAVEAPDITKALMVVADYSYN
jgi:hypothetical protein